MGGAAAGRRPGRRAAPAPGRAVRPGARRAGTYPGVHPHLAGAVRAVALGGAAGDAAGADPAAAVDAADNLRLRLLGPADHRSADRGELGPAGAPAAVRGGRAAHRGARARVGPPLDLDRVLPAAGPGAARLR